MATSQSLLAQQINRFIAQTHPNAPLAGRGDMLVRAGAKYGVDPRVLAIIARKESEFGTTSGRFRNNAWGWGVHLSPAVNTAPSFDVMAERVAKGLASNLYKGAGLKRLDQIIMRYAPPSENNTALYIKQIGDWYRQMGGNPSASVFGPVQSGGATPADAGAVPPAASASLPAGQLDARKLLKLLRGQTERSLQGIMPTANYRGELMDLAKESLPRAQTVVAARNTGTAVAQAATTAVGAVADKSSAQVINAAKEQLGVPYSWGGGTPAGPGRGFGRGANTVGFDCSSLVQYAWAKAGVNLPRTTYEQIKVGKGVPANNPAAWQPGDLLFPSTGHVQMYVGNGKVIEAPRTGGRVQVVGLRSKYIAVRRPG